MSFTQIKRLTISTLAISSLFFSSITYAQSLGELQNKQDEIGQNIDNKNSEIAEKQKSLDEINEQLKQLDAELGQAVVELNKINEQLDTVNSELTQAENDLEIAIQDKDEQYETLQKRVRHMYEYGQVSYLETLFGSTSFSDFLSRLEYLNAVHDYDENLYNELIEKQKQIEDLVEQINTKKEEVEALKQIATIKKDELESTIEQKTALNNQIESDKDLLEQQLTQLQQTNADIEQMIQEEIARQEEEARQEAARQEELAKQQALDSQNSSSNSSSSGTSGSLMWPSDTSYITSSFGYRTHPISGEPTKLHTGVDVGCATGSSVYSAESGKVLTSGWVSGYGNCVIILHDNGLQTLYGHLSQPVVSVGERVSRGQLIAYSGNSGNSTGPHLHFEVRVNGSPVDPMPYVK